MGIRMLQIFLLGIFVGGTFTAVSIMFAVVRHKDKMQQINDNTYHEGLVRGSHLREPLPYNDVLGPKPKN